MQTLVRYTCSGTQIEASNAESLDHIVSSKDRKNEHYAKFLSKQKRIVSVSLVPATKNKLLSLLPHNFSGKRTLQRVLRL